MASSTRATSSASEERADSTPTRSLVECALRLGPSGASLRATGSAAAAAAGSAEAIVIKDSFAPGTVALRVEERGATVQIDDKPVTLVKGAASVTLVAGLHRAVIRAPGHHDKLVEFQLESGKTLELTPDLDRKKDRGGTTRPPTGGSGSAAASGSAAGSASASGTASGSGTVDGDVVVNPFKKNK